MLYAILCYNKEDIVWSWTQAENDAVMGRLDAIRTRLEAEGRMGPSVRLMPTTAATSLRKGDEPLIVDGPFAETKEQLLGFYVVDCPDLEGALEVAKELSVANGGPGGYEIRPLALYNTGALPA